jgi:uridylate kinase
VKYEADFFQKGAKNVIKTKKIIFFTATEKTPANTTQTSCSLKAMRFITQYLNILIF